MCHFSAEFCIKKIGRVVILHNPANKQTNKHSENITSLADLDYKILLNSTKRADVENRHVLRRCTLLG